MPVTQEIRVDCLLNAGLMPCCSRSVLVYEYIYDRLFDCFFILQCSEDSDFDLTLILVQVRYKETKLAPNRSYITGIVIC